jgi:hypothetical protein
MFMSERVRECIVCRPCFEACGQEHRCVCACVSASAHTYTCVCVCVCVCGVCVCVCVCGVRGSRRGCWCEQGG